MLYLFFNIWVALSVFLIAAAINYIQNPIFQNYFQRHIPTKQRATIGSIKELMTSIGFFISMIIGGYLIDILGLRIMILVASLSSIPAIIILNKIKD